MSAANRRDAHDKLRALSESMLADVSGLSDDDILAETREDGIDPAQAAQDLRSEITRLTAKSRKRRLEEARESLKAARGVKSAGTRRPLVETIKRKLQALLASPRGQGLAIAFRNGHRQSDADLESLWDDLVEMGLVDEDGVQD